MRLEAGAPRRAGSAPASTTPATRPDGRRVAARAARADADRAPEATAPSDTRRSSGVTAQLDSYVTRARGAGARAAPRETQPDARRGRARPDARRAPAPPVTTPVAAAPSAAQPSAAKPSAAKPPAAARPATARSTAARPSASQQAQPRAAAPRARPSSAQSPSVDAVSARRLRPAPHTCRPSGHLAIPDRAGRGTGMDPHRRAQRVQPDGEGAAHGGRSGLPGQSPATPASLGSSWPPATGCSARPNTRHSPCARREAAAPPTGTAPCTGPSRRPWSSAPRT